MHLPFRRVDTAIASLAVFAIALAVVRACLQSITLDEAGTYRSFVAPFYPNQWAAHPNNHILNTLLMRLTTRVFGLSELTARMPALAGACLYVGACAVLCRRLFAGATLPIAVFVCAVFNPMIADYSAAARGYALALGLWMCAVALVAVPAIPRWCVASTLMGLAFTANFPFAFFGASSWTALLVWKCRRPRVLCAALLPGLCVAGMLTSWTLLHWPPGLLFDGARSLGESLATVAFASLYKPNAELASPPVILAAEHIAPFLFPSIGAALAAQAVLMFRRASDGRLKQFALVVLCSVVAVLAAHWIAFRCFGLLFPRNRMAVYLVPLLTLLAGAAAGARRTLPAHILTGLLCVLGAYHLLCIRTGHFLEWWTDADSKEVYYVLAYLHHRDGLRDIASELPITDSLEFYRQASQGRERFPEFLHSPDLPDGKQAYVIYESAHRDWIARERLKLIYRSPHFTDLVIAVRPEAQRCAGR